MNDNEEIKELIEANKEVIKLYYKTFASEILIELTLVFIALILLVK